MQCVIVLAGFVGPHAVAAGKGLLHHENQQAVIKPPPFADHFAFVKIRYQFAVDGAVHGHVLQFFKTHLLRGIPRGGKGFCAGFTAQIIHAGAAHSRPVYRVCDYS